jgi:hypothetical protein
MRYVKPLTQEEITLLETHYKTSPHHRERERCKALLLSNEKNNIRTLAAYFSLDPDTIHNRRAAPWITRWETPLPAEKSPLERLKDAFRSGRPSLLTVEQKKK